MTDTFKVGCAAVATFIITVLLVTALAVYAGLIALPLMNIQRQVTTHSQQYVQTHQTMLMSWYADYQSGDAAHQAAARTEICQNAPLLDPSELPAQITAFVSQNCQ